jgi:hypothetical protein
MSYILLLGLKKPNIVLFTYMSLYSLLKRIIVKLRLIVKSFWKIYIEEWKSLKLLINGKILFLRLT